MATRDETGREARTFWKEFRSVEARVSRDLATRDTNNSVRSYSNLTPQGLLAGSYDHDYIVVN